MPSLTQGLRELADFLDAHPDLDLGVQTYNIFVRDKAQLAKIARFGSWEKEFDSIYFMLRKRFSDGVILDINVPRAMVCEKVVIGKRIVPATQAHEEDITEWRCSNNSLLAGELFPTTGLSDIPFPDDPTEQAHRQRHPHPVQI